MIDLATTLIELNDWLKDEAPQMLEELGEPASADALAKLNEAYLDRVPQDILTVYSWHDGGQIPDPWWELSDIDEIIRVRELHESIPELRLELNWWSDNWIPIGADFDGNHLCVDLDGCFDGVSGQVLVFMHDDSIREIVAPSLGVYMETLLLACRAGVLECSEDEGFMTEGNDDAWRDFLSAQLVGYPRKEVAAE